METLLSRLTTLVRNAPNLAVGAAAVVGCGAAGTFILAWDPLLGGGLGLVAWVLWEKSK